MHQAVDAVAAWIERLLALVLIGAVLLNFANVVGRYGFGVGLSAADELQTYSMVYMAFLGAALASWRGLHLRMDVLLTRFPPVFRRILAVTETLLVIVLSGLVSWVASQYVGQMYSLGALSQTAQIPMWIPHAAIVAGFGLMVVVSLLQLFARP